MKLVHVNFVRRHWCGVRYFMGEGWLRFPVTPVTPVARGLRNSSSGKDLFTAWDAKNRIEITPY